MKNTLVILCLVLAVVGHAQHNKQAGNADSTPQQIVVPNVDSLVAASQKQMDSINTAASINRMNENTANWLAQRSAENDRKTKQGIWVRIGLGITFLIVGIVGMRRKKKVKDTASTTGQ